MSKFVNNDIIYFDPPNKYSKLFYNIPKEFFEHYKGEIIQGSSENDLYVVCITKDNVRRVSFPLSELEGKFFCEKASEYDDDVFKYKNSKIYSDIGGVIPAPNVDDYDKTLYGNGTWGNQIQGERVQYVDHTVTAFPTMRADGTPLQDEDFVESSENAEFSIQGVMFKKKGDCAFYDSKTGTWSNSVGIIVNSGEVTVSADECLNDSSPVNTQKQWNIEVKEYLGKQRYEYLQLTESSNWVIVHNLGKEPHVSVFNIDGDEIECDKKHNGVNEVVITVNPPMKGKAILSV